MPLYIYGKLKHRVMQYVVYVDLSIIYLSIYLSIYLQYLSMV